MANSDCDRNLLFGILALHNGFISRDALIRAMSTWVADKQTPLGQLLVRQGDLQPDHHFLMEALVKAHLKQHSDDPEQSLAAINTTALVKVLADHFGDADVIASLAPSPHVTDAANEPPANAEGVGAPTSSGRRFHVIRAHAAGALGEVFLARDHELNREVALKQIKERYCTDRDSQTRFVTEAEITGGLEHPGIVPVYGLGHDEQRGPYYAMRFIRGESLKDAIDLFHRAGATSHDRGARSLKLRKLLGRFVDVCDAIAYAHSRGVVHRDIKPANIMLGKFGETLVVDWGLAKAVGRDDIAAKVNPGEMTLRPSPGSSEQQTLPGSTMGTPAYMSPEQAAGDLDRVGLASDIYSLGATLYTILAGCPPVNDTDIQVVLWAVRRGEFPPPSSVRPKVNRHLEAVCLKAMARHPDERYPSAQALARDIEHWLADEPVTAWREPPLHRARRWARHHRTAVSGTVAALLVALAASVAIAGLMAAAAREERLLADRERTAKTLAEARLGQIDKANDLLGSVFQNLDPRAEEKEGKPLRAILGDRLKQAAASLQGETIGDPLTVAKLQDILGTSQMNLGNMAEAIVLLTQSYQTRAARLGPDHPDTLTSRNDLATAYWSAGRNIEAIEVFEATLKARESMLGPNDPDTLTSRDNLAVAYESAGRTDEAIKLHEAALEAEQAALGPDHPNTLTSRSNLANAYLAAGRTDEAIKLHEATLKAREARLGPDHTNTLTSRNNLAVAYKYVGRTDEAIKLHEATLKAREATLGPDHPDTLASLANLADAYELVGQFAKQEPLAREGLERARRKFGPADLRTAPAKVSLGQCLIRLGKWSEAEPVLRELLSQREAREPEAWTTFNIRSLLGAALLGQGRYAEAEPLIVSGYEGITARGTVIPASYRTLRLSEAADRVVRLYDAWGTPGLAARWKLKLGLADLPADVFVRP